MPTKHLRAKGMLASSMLIFGTIGLFRRYIPLPSSLLALLRGVVGMLFLLLVLRLRKQKPNRGAIRRCLPLLLLSGGILGFNWILLFEAYQYTSVATATLCYYMAPVIVLLLSPVLFKETLTARKLLCIVGAVVGIALVSGFGGGAHSASEWKGILLGLAAAAFYAGVILLNKTLTGLSAYDRTILQLGASSLILLPYTAATGGFANLTLSAGIVGLVLLVGILHTGIAYALYFGSMSSLPAQTVALYSYIDPVAAVLLSAAVLHEGMSLAELLGAVLVLGATLISELPAQKQ